MTQLQSKAEWASDYTARSGQGLMAVCATRSFIANGYRLEQEAGDVQEQVSDEQSNG